jgi:hypothetical protein
MDKRDFDISNIIDKLDILSDAEKREIIAITRLLLKRKVFKSSKSPPASINSVLITFSMLIRITAN